MNRAERRKKQKETPQDERPMPKTPLFGTYQTDIENQAYHISHLAFHSAWVDESWVAENIISICLSECKKAEMNARHETEKKLEKWLLKHGIDAHNITHQAHGENK